jgi:polysaccharide export outer membrane protein
MIAREERRTRNVQRSSPWLVWIALALGACAPAPPRAPASPSDDAAFDVETPPPPGVSENEAPPPDSLCAGDLLSVRYLGNKDVEPQNVIVDRNGAIHLPLAGDVRVGDHSVGDAELLVQDRLRRYDRFSTVSLTVVESKGRIVTVNGAVEHPGNVPIVGDARVADVLASVGGPRLAATADKGVVLGDLDGTRLVRSGKTLPIDARQALEGVPRHNVRVLPGDVIFVPPAVEGRIVVLGQVGHPQTVAYRRGLRLTEVLADCGGLTKDADGEDIRIVRGGYAHPRLYVANAHDVLAAARPDVTLAPGDVVFVTEHWFASVGDVLDRIVPIAATGALLTAVK